ncbi:hypothetical protein L3Q82_003190 [Scortum barcoo]|uniref:Uncharacterized protein n=1 Tax=Scortum barcoo TaxID=214431 RepID=A0ACB8VRU3_9TELE|nr:hypothetical protein L3Q82_003190 [Scortum barcoo]
MDQRPLEKIQVNKQTVGLQGRTHPKCEQDQSCLGVELLHKRVSDGGILGVAPVEMSSGGMDGRIVVHGEEEKKTRRAKSEGKEEEEEECRAPENSENVARCLRQTVPFTPPPPSSSISISILLHLSGARLIVPARAADGQPVSVDCILSLWFVQRGAAFIGLFLTVGGQSQICQQIMTETRLPLVL